MTSAAAAAAVTSAAAAAAVAAAAVAVTAAAAAAAVVAAVASGLGSDRLQAQQQRQPQRRSQQQLRQRSGDLEVRVRPQPQQQPRRQQQLRWHRGIGALRTGTRCAAGRAVLAAVTATAAVAAIARPSELCSRTAQPRCALSLVRRTERVDHGGAGARGCRCRSRAQALQQRKRACTAGNVCLSGLLLRGDRTDGGRAQVAHARLSPKTLAAKWWQCSCCFMVTRLCGELLLLLANVICVQA
eukprot:TRINITY_DN7680_c0_g2_i1.p1 TRINITY_DN7680_c0_g2~~TRINITY_DN7680_c0_g2_i1.p1  ORF type:complete len:242 (+),score=56.86 TRINITY_DN7680_c0_g2_i1:557-1282(+)